MSWRDRIITFVLSVMLGGTMVLLVTAAFGQEVVYTDSTTRSTVRTDGDMTTTVISPPPSAISPQIGTATTSDLCTVGVAGAVQTQILGISAGKTVRDMNCEKLKNAKTLYDMGMKVAAVSVMCQDKRIFDAMMDAGTPCPYDGLIGDQAKAAWESDPDRVPGNAKKGLADGSDKSTTGFGAVLGVLALLLLL